MSDPGKNYYVDRKELYDVLCEWHERKLKAEAAGEPPPKLPDYVGNVILMMAHGMAKRYNFRDYTWIDEMVGSGIEAAIKALNKFDPNRKGRNGEVNPYGFINFILWREFVTVIKFEKQRNERLKEMMLDPEYESFEEDESGNGSDYIDNSNLSDFFYRGA